MFDNTEINGIGEDLEEFKAYERIAEGTRGLKELETNIELGTNTTENINSVRIYEFKVKKGATYWIKFCPVDNVALDCILKTVSIVNIAEG